MCHDDSNGLKIGQGRELRNTVVCMGWGCNGSGWPEYRTKHGAQFLKNLANSSEGKRNAIGRTGNRILTNNMP